MLESWPYRKELAEFAASFRRRAEKQPWRDDSLAKAERMLFVGFLFVRKLIECQKVSDACARSSATVLRARIRRTREVSGFNRNDLHKDFGAATWHDARVDVHQVADKVIHAWWILPVQDEDRGLAGFVFTTDRQRNSELWLLPTLSIADAFERFARSPIQRMSAGRDENGKLTYWKAE